MSSSVNQSETGQRLVPSEEKVRASIRAYIVGTFLLGAGDSLEDSTPLMENGILDSTAAMELVAFLEDEFNIEVGEDETVADNLNSVDNICSFVTRKLR